MRGTGLVVLNGEAIYAYFAEVAGVARVRLSVDEWERLRLSAGQWVRAGLPGREPVSLLVTDVLSVPPFVWVDLAAGAERPAQVAS